MQRLFLLLKHCNGENENKCNFFHDVVGWSRLLERRPPDQKTSMQWAKTTKSQCQKSRATVPKKCATVARLFQKK